MSLVILLTYILGQEGGNSGFVLLALDLLRKLMLFEFKLKLVPQAKCEFHRQENKVLFCLREKMKDHKMDLIKRIEESAVSYQVKVSC